MSIAYQDDFVTLRTGTALDVLREMPEKSVHMSVCSPPYWGLRSYLPQDHPAKGQEIGTERTPDEFVAKLVEVFAEVWRVLRDDGQLWVNIGDSYAGGKVGNTNGGTACGLKRDGRLETSRQKSTQIQRENMATMNFTKPLPPGLKPKDLCMIPARLAIALQSWGWYLRQELVWAKDSCMPESVRDRCTRAHEFVYMLTKKPRYFYDSIAIAEPVTESSLSRLAQDVEAQAGSHRANGGAKTNGTMKAVGSTSTRNARSVWKINPKPYPGSHFATFPPELPQRCIKAGTSERGVCSECGAPWRRVVERENGDTEAASRPKHLQSARRTLSLSGNGSKEWAERGGKAQTVGWEPTCDHSPYRVVRTERAGPGVTRYVTGHPVPATVLDPFAGSGTTLYAARKLGRKSIGIDIDEKSAELLQARLGNQGVLL